MYRECQGNTRQQAITDGHNKQSARRLVRFPLLLRHRLLFRLPMLCRIRLLVLCLCLSLCPVLIRFRLLRLCCSCSYFCLCLRTRIPCLFLCLVLFLPRSPAYNIFRSEEVSVYFISLLPARTRNQRRAQNASIDAAIIVLTNLSVKLDTRHRHWTNHTTHSRHTRET